MLSEWNAEVNAFRPRPKDRHSQDSSGYSDTKSTQHPALKASNAKARTRGTTDPPALPLYLLQPARSLVRVRRLSRLNEVLALAATISPVTRGVTWTPNAALAIRSQSDFEASPPGRLPDDDTRDETSRGYFRVKFRNRLAPRKRSVALITRPGGINRGDNKANELYRGPRSGQVVRENRATPVVSFFCFSRQLAAGQPCLRQARRCAPHKYPFHRNEFDSPNQ